MVLLHNHPEQEKELENIYGKFFADTHVIVNTEDWNRVQDILSGKQSIEGTVKFPVLVVVNKVVTSSEKGTSTVSLNVEGRKDDSEKLRFDLIPADALEEVAKVFTFGAKKYGDRNWEKGLSYGRLFGALMRHAWAWWKGESYDSENKCHHLSSVVFSALALLHYELNLEKFETLDNRKERNE